ncbi:2'-5' RNA ligase family protein [Frankia sp. AgB32]|nr:2'-5' RNA ligase family protein [Frankia sp. AgB32]
MTARLFVAVLPPATVVDALAVATARARRAAPELRWSGSDRWHVTLAFLGPVPDERRVELDDRLARVARRHAPIPVETVGGGRFGDRVLWTGVRAVAGGAAGLTGTSIGGDRALVALATGVRRAVERAAVIGADSRPLRAHLTLARVPGSVDRDLETLVGLLRADVAPLPWTVDRIVLMRSVDGPPGSPVDYQEQASWRLTGRRGPA